MKQLHATCVFVEPKSQLITILMVTNLIVVSFFQMQKFDFPIFRFYARFIISVRFPSCLFLSFLQSWFFIFLVSHIRLHS